MTRIAEKPFEAAEKPPLDRTKATRGQQLTPILDSQKTFKSIIETTMRVLNTIAALQANASAKFSHLHGLIGAKSAFEVVELQSAVLRKRVDMAFEQTKGTPGADHKVGADVSMPIKDAFETVLADLKAA